MTTKEDVPTHSSETSFNYATQGTTYLFFMAIDEYKHDITPLSNTVRDATAVSNCLIERYQMSRDNLKILFNEQASRNNILDAFDWYTQHITAEDNLIFYFSGHGHYHPLNKSGYWLTADSVSENRTTFLNNDEVISYIKNINARHIFGIVDACFSEALFLKDRSMITTNRRFSIPSRWLLTAGRLEPVFDGIEGEHSPFATSLLTQLKATDTPELWVSELCPRVIKGVQYNSEDQTPRGEPLLGVGHEGGDFLFLRKGQSFHKVNSNSQNKTSSGNFTENTPITRSFSNTQKIEQLRIELSEKLSENEWDSVFENLKNILHPSGRKRSILILLIARHNSINKINQAEIESTRSIKRLYNKLRADLLAFIRGLKENDIE